MVNLLKLRETEEFVCYFFYDFKVVSSKTYYAPFYNM